jgi:prophage regulatory protein
LTLFLQALENSHFQGRGKSILLDKISFINPLLAGLAMKQNKIYETKVILPETGFIRVDEILELFPVGRTTWWQGVRYGKYPKPVKLSPRTTAWRVEDIRNLIDTCGATKS